MVFEYLVDGKPAFDIEVFSVLSEKDIKPVIHFDVNGEECALFYLSCIRAYFFQFFGWLLGPERDWMPPKLMIS